jgi:hypothetical protein
VYVAIAALIDAAFSFAMRSSLGVGMGDHGLANRAMRWGYYWRPADHFDRERYSGAEDEARYHDGHKRDGETKQP